VTADVVIFQTYFTIEDILALSIFSKKVEISWSSQCCNCTTPQWRRV